MVKSMVVTDRCIYEWFASPATMPNVSTISPSEISRQPGVGEGGV